MKKISSGNTFLLKTIFPLIWFAALAFITVMMVVTDTSRQAPPVAFAVPAFMAIVGFVIMKKLVWDLVDEVQDGEDFLLVRNRGHEERVPLSNIMNVSASTQVNPPRITLRLVKAGKFGNEISFTPKRDFTLNPFARNRIADGLIVRVDRARIKRLSG